MNLERHFQHSLINELSQLFPGCIVLKNDSSHITGIPDLTILYKDKYAVLECKRYANSKKQNNQKYYIDTIGKYTFTAFIHQENRQEVLNELQQAFSSRR